MPHPPSNPGPLASEPSAPDGRPPGTPPGTAAEPKPLTLTGFALVLAASVGAFLGVLGLFLLLLPDARAVWFLFERSPVPESGYRLLGFLFLLAATASLMLAKLASDGLEAARRGLAVLIMILALLFAYVSPRSLPIALAIGVSGALLAAPTPRAKGGEAAER